MQKVDIINEITMNDHQGFECIDQSLQDVYACAKSYLGGLTVLFSGEWKQILLVVLHGLGPQIIEVTVKKSYF